MEFEIDRASVRFADRLKKPPVEGAAMVDNRWVLTVKSLADLLDIVKREDSVIVSQGLIGGRPEITIYDDYVE